MSKITLAALKIGVLDVGWPVMLAPMAGYTDLPFRRMCKRYGAGMVFTEVVTVEGVIRYNSRTMHYLKTMPEERPVGAQVYGTHPDSMAQAARVFETMGVFDLIDINCGCPVRKITRRGAGVALMREPEAIKTIVVRSGGLREDRVHTIHGGTDCSIFDPVRVDRESIRLKLGLGRSQLLIGQFSVRDWKGWSDLMAAFARLAARFPPALLLLVGCEPETAKAEVEGTAREAGLSGRVMALPSRTDMPDVLAACDVVVDASWEGTGITGTIREAMAMQRAVVATDCGGNRELVVDGEVGLVVPPRNPEALAAALTRLIEDPDLRHHLGTAARRRVVEHFSTEKRIDRLEALYWKVLEEPFEPGDGTRKRRACARRNRFLAPQEGFEPPT